MPSLNLTLSAFVVAGGGGGGGNSSAGTGGGGAGGVVFRNGFTISTGATYNIIIGDGGAGGTSINNFDGGNGQNSSIVGILTATGGGGGAGGVYTFNGLNGGAGGGGGANVSIAGNGGINTGSQGFSGGDGFKGVVAYGGGGGGAGQSGFKAVSNNGGNGGRGIIIPIPGSTTVGQLSAGNYWVAGGGGGSATFGGIGLTQGGLGGGGNGSPNSPVNGSANTGGGGGGGYTANGGSGGSGVVILSMPTSQYSGITTGSPLVSVFNGNIILTFTSNGSYTAISSTYYTLPQKANAGTLFFNQGFDISKDVVVTFDYACYGSGYTGSEGFSVFFTSTLSGLSGGGPGPGLCYSPVLNVDSANSQILSSFPGVLYGALGIGFDITGDFGTNFYGTNGLANPVQNSITIRDNYDNNYQFLYNSGDLNNNIFPFPFKLYEQIVSQTPTYNRIRVRLTDFGQRVSIDIKRPTDYLFSNFINYVLPSSGWWPDCVYCGLGFATGQNITTFKVRNFNINGVYLSAYRTWEYDLDQSSLSGSYFTTSTKLSALSSFLYVGNTINIVNSVTTGYYLSGAPLIQITPGGTAGLQSGDQYIIIQ
jgi:hypothetical protein